MFLRLAPNILLVISHNRFSLLTFLFKPASKDTLVVCVNLHCTHHPQTKGNVACDISYVPVTIMTAHLEAK